MFLLLCYTLDQIWTNDNHKNECPHVIYNMTGTFKNQKTNSIKNSILKDSRMAVLFFYEECTTVV